MLVRHLVRLSTSSELMTWLTGSCVVGPGSTSAREQSPSSEESLGDWLKER